MADLQIHEIFKRFSEGTLSDNELIDAVGLIKSAEKAVALGSQSSNKDDYKRAKQIIDEVYRFEQEQNIAKIKKAKSIVFRGPAALKIFDKHEFDRLHYMPSRTKSQRAKKHELKAELNMLYRSSKRIKKMFPDGITEPDEQELIDALNMPETNREEKKAKKLAVKAAQHRRKKFYTAAKPYVEAKKLIQQYYEYKNWEKLEARYHELNDKAKA